MDDLRARLDRAITEARELLLGVAAEWGECPGEPECGPGAHSPHLDRTLDRYAALVAVRARMDEHVVIPCDNENCLGWKQLAAEAERLLGEEDA